MAARRKTRADERADQVRHLIALDATNVLRRLAARHDEMVTLFSRLRSRAPLLETIASTFQTAEFEALAGLTRKEQTAVNAFYESLDELRWYLQYTEDMPLMVRKTATQHLLRLQRVYALLVAALGTPSPDASPVVEVEVVAREEKPEPGGSRRALASGDKSRPRG